jgi:hypothetical protein
MIRPAAEVLLALERECLKVDAAITTRAWSACEASWRVQRKLTHELEFALREIAPASTEMQLAVKRIERLRRYRDGQLKRLQAFNAALGKRLATLERFRSFTKVNAAQRPSRLLDVTS